MLREENKLNCKIFDEDKMFLLLFLVHNDGSMISQKVVEAPDPEERCVKRFLVIILHNLWKGIGQWETQVPANESIIFSKII